MTNRVSKYLDEFQTLKEKNKISSTMLYANEVEELHQIYETAGMFDLIMSCVEYGYIAGVKAERSNQKKA